MFRCLIRRILWAVVLFFAVTVVTYIIFFVIPADPARAFAGKNPRPEQIKRSFPNRWSSTSSMPGSTRGFAWRNA